MRSSLCLINIYDEGSLAGLFMCGACKITKISYLLIWFFIESALDIFIVLLCRLCLVNLYGDLVINN